MNHTFFFLISTSIKFKVRLDELQVKELEALRSQLKQEEDVLTTYQTKQSKHLQSHIEREMSELENRVTLRKELLEHRVSEATLSRSL